MRLAPQKYPKRESAHTMVVTPCVSIAGRSGVGALWPQGSGQVGTNETMCRSAGRGSQLITQLRYGCGAGTGQKSGRQAECAGPGSGGIWQALAIVGFCRLS